MRSDVPSQVTSVMTTTTRTNATVRRRGITRSCQPGALIGRRAARALAGRGGMVVSSRAGRLARSGRGRSSGRARWVALREDLVRAVELVRPEDRAAGVGRRRELRPLPEVLGGARVTRAVAQGAVGPQREPRVAAERPPQGAAVLPDLGFPAVVAHDRPTLRRRVAG